jgi:DNA polymerase III epsilon subunit-like protein
MKIQLNHHEALSDARACAQLYLLSSFRDQIRNISYLFFHYFSLLITRLYDERRFSPLPQI